MTHLWIRSETRACEQRTPLTPDDAAQLARDGFQITVERSTHRIFTDAEYEAAGITMAETGSWVDAPEDAYIVGLKELPDGPEALRHTHVMFGHAYKGQAGGMELLQRFRRGGGELLDFEYVAIDGRRLIAFGYFAGYVGAGLAILAARGVLPTPVTYMSREELDGKLRSSMREPHDVERVVVTGARGRSGTGAVEAALLAGCEVSRWDRAETAQLNKAELLAHDMLVHCVVTDAPHEPFLTDEDLSANTHRLRIISDVTCDVTSDCNLLPINDDITTWEEPVRRLHHADETPVDVIAIDNLPSLMPREASQQFSTQFVTLVPSLSQRQDGWYASAQAFVEHAPASV